jgi:predicted ATPase
VSASDYPVLPGSAPPLLVGRERELGVLRQQLDAAIAGHGSLALIGGEAGIGKTALAEALCHEATDAGALVLVGRCYDLTETPPYGPWREIAARGPTGTDLPSLPLALTEDGTTDGITSQAGLFAAVRRYVAALACRQPLVFLLDDLHWADAASLDLLRILARDLGDVALLILATYRSDALPLQHPLAQLLPTLIRESRATRLELHPLEPADVEALVAGRYTLLDADRERLAADLHARAEGNPFFTMELLRSLTDERVLRPAEAGWCLGDLTRIRVPAGVREVVAARVARLDPATRDLLQTAAILGDHINVALIRAVGDLPEAARHIQAAEAIEQLHARDLSSYLAMLTGHHQRAG